jgi:probable F420-dependent oxidoreductase
VELGGVGVWSTAFRGDDEVELADAAAELEELGYSALWFPGLGGGPLFDWAATLLEATTEVAVATGILNVWMHEPAEAAAGRARLAEAHPGRFLLGLGISHPVLVDRDQPGRYRRPLAAMRAYLDELDAAEPPVPRDERCLAALAPRMLELARERTAGSHPYFVPPEHTRLAREALGPDALLAPEQAVVLEQDRTRAREIARAHVAFYLGAVNYTNNLLRVGYGEEDFADGGSDRLVDALVACGDEEAIRRRVQEHFDAGADHVCIQVLAPPEGPSGSPWRTDLARADWRELAPALIS